MQWPACPARAVSEDEHHRPGLLEPAVDEQFVAGMRDDQSGAPLRPFGLAEVEWLGNCHAPLAANRPDNHPGAASRRLLHERLIPSKCELRNAMTVQRRSDYNVARTSASRQPSSNSGTSTHSLTVCISF